MEKHVLLFLTVHFLSLHFSNQMLQPFESQALLSIQQLLNYPSALGSFNYSTLDFCSIEPTPSLTLVCYEDNLTQLHILGKNAVPLLPQNFSIDYLFATLGRFSSLKVMSLVSLGLRGELPGSIARLSSLEILNLSSNYFSGSIPSELSSLRNLQTLILDHNSFTGQVYSWLSSLHSLSVFSVKNNSLDGSLPDSIATLQNLRILIVSGNQLSGEVPDLQNLTNLQVLDLEDNHFGPHFPSLQNKVLTLILKNNSFQSGIPPELGFFYQLQKLDISLNGFVGPFLPSLLALPAINYLDISGNKLTGRLFLNMSCNPELAFVNLSTNFLTGNLPTCLQSTSSKRVILYASNCLSDEEREQGQEQHPSELCHNEALAVKILPDLQKNKRHDAKAVLASSIIGGIGVTTIIVYLVSWILQRKNCRNALRKSPSTRLIINKVSAVNTAKLLSDARYISETMKMGANLPPYRTFALEELKNTTNNFDPSSLMDDYQTYRGELKDGTLVAMRSLKMKKRSRITYTHHIELVSKLRHSHLASALGHCFECCLDDSSTIGLAYLIFEYVSNCTLRDCISGVLEQRLSWTQRIAAAIGVTKGIQFLHTGIVPGVFSNNLKITDVLVDQNLRVKIRSYNLPLITENWGTVGVRVCYQESKANTQPRENHKDKNDVYDIGVILLEMIVGRTIMSENDVEVTKDILQVSLTMDDTARRSIADPKIVKECSAESLKIAMELCLRCLSNEPADRPSVEDVLWNMQFAAQLQDSPRGDSQNSL
ncbi:hypothetical protein SLE2022_067010 [Rubroshorea leprosula]